MTFPTTLRSSPLEFLQTTLIVLPLPNVTQLETLINQDLLKVKEWCDIDRVSIKFNKTNYMIIKSNQKKIAKIHSKLNFLTKVDLNIH